MFCCTLLYVHSSFAIILIGKSESLLLCLVCLLVSLDGCVAHAVPWVCLQFVVVVFPDHTHYFFLTKHLLVAKFAITNI